MRLHHLIISSILGFSLIACEGKTLAERITENIKKYKQKQTEECKQKHACPIPDKST